MLAMLLLRVRNKKCGLGSGKCAAWTVTGSGKPRPPFQALVMSEESRLGREQIETAYALKQLVDAGVRVFFYLEDRERTHQGHGAAGRGPRASPPCLPPCVRGRTAEAKRREPVSRAGTPPAPGYRHDGDVHAARAARPAEGGRGVRTRGRVSMLLPPGTQRFRGADGSSVWCAGQVPRPGREVQVFAGSLGRPA
jgi:hypothetical protein